MATYQPQSPGTVKLRVRATNAAGFTLSQEIVLIVAAATQTLTGSFDDNRMSYAGILNLTTLQTIVGSFDDHRESFAGSLDNVAPRPMVGAYSDNRVSYPGELIPEGQVAISGTFSDNRASYPGSLAIVPPQDMAGSYSDSRASYGGTLDLVAPQSIIGSFSDNRATYTGSLQIAPHALPAPEDTSMVEALPDLPGYSRYSVVDGDDYYASLGDAQLRWGKGPIEAFPIVGRHYQGVDDTSGFPNDPGVDIYLSERLYDDDPGTGGQIIEERGPVYAFTVGAPVAEISWNSTALTVGMWSSSNPTIDPSDPEHSGPVELGEDEETSAIIPPSISESGGEYQLDNDAWWQTPPTTTTLEREGEWQLGVAVPGETGTTYTPASSGDVSWVSRVGAIESRSNVIEHVAGWAENAVVMAGGSYLYKNTSLGLPSVEGFVIWSYVPGAVGSIQVGCEQFNGGGFRQATDGTIRMQFARSDGGTWQSNTGRSVVVGERANYAFIRRDVGGGSTLIQGWLWLEGGGGWIKEFEESLANTVLMRHDLDHFACFANPGNLVDRRLVGTEHGMRWHIGGTIPDFSQPTVRDQFFTGANLRDPAVANAAYGLGAINLFGNKASYAARTNPGSAGTFTTAVGFT